jgi:uncharacterized protein
MIDPVFEPRIWDYAFVAFFALAMPLWMAFRTLPRIRALTRAEQDAVRTRIYISAILSHWLMTAAALSPWLLGNAELAALGAGFPLEYVPRLGVALALIVVAGMVLVVQRRRALEDPESRKLVREAVRSYEWLLPKTNRERALWVVVSLHAGVCEELFFRGYLLALLNHSFSFWVAAAIAALLFGFAHLYQGGRGMVGTGIVGVLMIGLYALSGSLWVCMIAHTVYDMHGGEFGRRALRDDQSDSTA